MKQDVRIDRLSLRVPGLDEDAARDLARLVAQRLAADLPVSNNPISDNRVSGNRTSDNRVSDNRVSDNRGSDSRVSDSRMSDSRMSDSRGSDSSVSGGLSIRVIGDGVDPDILAWRIAGEIRGALERGKTT
jgi:hypothetical protein